MKIVIYITVCLYAVTGYGQTKLISFRSHSGNNVNFRTAVEHDLFDIGNSNFGLIEVDKIDSVIMVSNDRIIVLRRRLGSGIKKARRDTLTRTNASDLFAATSIQSLKTALRNKYDRASFDNTIFIGFNDKFKHSNSAPKK